MGVPPTWPREKRAAAAKALAAIIAAFETASMQGANDTTPEPRVASPRRQK